MANLETKASNSSCRTVLFLILLPSEEDCFVCILTLMTLNSLGLSFLEPKIGCMSHTEKTKDKREH